MPPAKRGLAMVFQSYALYPHMSVRKNIAFPLRMAKMDQAEIDTPRSNAAAEALNLTDYLDRSPGQLSGGQRQRVAIGRAIVREPRRSCSTNRCPTSMRRCGSACAGNLRAAQKA